MEEAKKSMLVAAGIDVDELFERFMDNEALAMKFLRRFPEDTNFQRLQQALKCSNEVEAFEAAHTLKGVVGNLSMHSLYYETSDLVERLRAGNLEEARKRMPDVEKSYAKTLAALQQLG